MARKDSPRSNRAASKRPQTSPDTITQAEIKTFLAGFNSLREMAIGIRRRIEAGATVAAGRYTAQSAGIYDPLSGYQKAVDRSAMFGLYIDPAASPERSGEKSAHDLPDWAFATPEVAYELSMYPRVGAGSGFDQYIHLTRVEFVDLKRALAGMRGLKVSDSIEHC